MPEKIEELIPGKVRILQAEGGYRYSIDPFLLISFASISDCASVVDLGSGSGVMPLLLSENSGVEKITGLELQDSLVERSRRSIVLNHLESKVEIIQGDVRDLPEEILADPVDVVVTNPPYRAVGKGRVAPDGERAQARHELAGGLTDFLRAGHSLLKHGGKFNIIYLAERLPELLMEMHNSRLEPKRLRVVHSRPGEKARLVLVEGRKNASAGMMIEKPLYIYDGPGREYTRELLSICGRRCSLLENERAELPEL